MYPSLLSEYFPEAIFTADNVGHFSAYFQGKRSKDRITVLVCANIGGYEKIPFLVIGKSEKPHCFKHMKSLPCTYKHNSSAWITYMLLMEFLTCL